MQGEAQLATFVALITLALGANVVFRREREGLHRRFAWFAFAVGVREGLAGLFALRPSPSARQVGGAATVAVAFFAMRFFQAFVRIEERPRTLIGRSAPLFALPVLAVLASPVGGGIPGDLAVAGFVLVSFTTTLLLLERVRRSTRSRREAERIRFLTFTGAVAGILTLADYVPGAEYFGADALAPVFLLIFLYMLAQAVLRERVLDLYDLLGRAAVLASLALVLAFVMVMLLRVTGTSAFAPAFVASLTVLLVLEPLRDAVEAWLHRLFFVDRRELERTLAEARARIAASIDPASAARIALDALEAAGRVTHAAVYFVDADRRGFALAHAAFGSAPPRLDVVALHPLLARLEGEDVVLLESLERELDRHRRKGRDREAESAFEVKSRLEGLDASVALAIRATGGEVVGILLARDERVRDAFAQDELPLLTSLSATLGEAFSRSVEHLAAKDRDRLVALGEMAAGLAHEIRNPLGAIKGTAQLLGDGGEEKELLSILVEEVDRLNRVVGGFLDYARPTTTAPGSCSPGATVERTIQLLKAEPLAQGPSLELEVEPGLPEVRIDAEKLRQVVINLCRNALEALDGTGRLRITVRAAAAPAGREGSFVEIVVVDDGPGIDADLLPRLFVPFVTTKQRGTGLGLATSQRLVAEAGGLINVKSEKGRGAVFTVRLPVARSAQGGTEIESGSTRTR